MRTEACLLNGKELFLVAKFNPHLLPSLVGGEIAYLPGVLLFVNKEGTLVQTDPENLHLEWLSSTEEITELMLAALELALQDPEQRELLKGLKVRDNGQPL
jgi:hypothetical protein